MLSFLYVSSDHSILECYNLFSGVELSMRSFCVISTEFYRAMFSAVLSSGLSFEKAPPLEYESSV